VGKSAFPGSALYAGQLEKAAEAIRLAGRSSQDPLLAAMKRCCAQNEVNAAKRNSLIRKATHGGASLLHTHHMMHTVAAAYGVWESRNRPWLGSAKQLPTASVVSRIS